MKKGKWEIEKLPSREFVLSSCGDELTMQDLKDLRDLITEELGEEVCPNKLVANCICSQCYKMERQPLTEGEGEKKLPCKDVEHLDKYCRFCQPQQESNKEERKSEEFVEWQCSTCGRDWSVTTFKCPMCFKEEPSKKEEQRCGGLGCKLPWQHPGACYQGVSQEPSKKPSMTIGCNECGNNIRI